MNKIDERLLKIATMTEYQNGIICVVYYNDFKKTIEYFKLNSIRILNHISFINACIVNFDTFNIIKASKEDYISYISSISAVSALTNISRKILNVDNCSYRGKNIGIAIIDTGINNHLDFCLKKTRIIKFVDFINGLNVNYDDNGHGTFVAGVAAGSGIVSNGKYAGMAKDANIVALKALNEKGEANAISILQAMQWVYDNYKKYNIRIACMSFGSEPLGNSDPIMKGAEKLWDEGIVVVCAGGNSGPNFNTIKSPGVSRKIITVGGLDDKRDIQEKYNEDKFVVAEFSSRGPSFGRIKPDIIAPSVNIISCSHLGGYRQMSGTSVATPMVAGICAILLERYPFATPKQIKKHLILNAKDIHKNMNIQGYGVAKLKID